MFKHLMAYGLAVVLLAANVGNSTVLFATTPDSAAAVNSDNPVSDFNAPKSRLERLVAVGKLWGTIKYFHPYLAYREDLDWDQALVKALPQIQGAADPAQYQAAVTQLLSGLQDPATVVINSRLPTTAKEAAEKETTLSIIQTQEDGTVVINLSNQAAMAKDPQLTVNTLRIAAEKLIGASGIVFDLRTDQPLTEFSKILLNFAFREIFTVNLFSATALQAPAQRCRMHVGFRPQRGTTSGSYYSAFYTVNSEPFVTTKPGKDRPAVFLINEHSFVPALALALQNNQKGAILGTTINDSTLVNTTRVSLGAGLQAQVRLGELINPDGSGLHHHKPPVTDSATTDSATIEQALALAKNFKPVPLTTQKLPLAVVHTFDKTYSETPYPTAAYRLLAGFRVWAVFNHFFPYNDLMGESWDDVLREFIPRLEAAADEREYHLTIAEMVTHARDSHVVASSRVLRDLLGVAPAGVHVRLIEHQPVITGFRDEQLANNLAIGDVILAIDGEDVKTYLGQRARYFAASTLQGLENILANTLLNGATNSTVTLRVQTRQGQIKEVSVPRKAEFAAQVCDRQGEIVRILSGNIGYVDLARLSYGAVTAMFEKLKDTRAIIFDMRGYPQGTAWAIAPRLTARRPVPAARFQRPMVMALEISDDVPRHTVVNDFVQTLPTSDDWKYKNPTVMLIDERAISQAEHTGLFLESANGTKFVGSPTNGANGDVTNFSVPGGIFISFTGQAVRHLDGRQLQRVGLQPDIPVTPTIKGIQAGRDEVLEKAIEYLSKQEPVAP
jgi:C-terminal processing protease CtpA/Prc